MSSIDHSKMQTFMTNRSFSGKGRKNSREKNYFALDLYQAMIRSNKPLNKLSKHNFKNFPKRYCTNQSITEDHTLRKFM